MQLSTPAFPPFPRLSRAAVLRASLYLLAVFLFCLSHWIHKYFGRPDIDQIAYHLAFGIDLVRFSDPILARRFVDWCVLVPLVLLAMLLVADARLRSAIGRMRTPFHQRLLAVHRTLPLLLIATSATYWVADMGLAKHLAAQFGTDYFGANYVPPAHQPLLKRAPKNLILIYVESLEAGYADRRVFGRDLIAPLTALGGQHFRAYEQAPGTGWTIAAIVSTQCGLPLERVTLFDINTQGQMVNSFLNNATCLGDLLAQQGYRNVFLGGASPEFAGKGKFLRQHRYQEVYGREDWLKSGVREQDLNGWGTYDADLFARARTRLAQLEASGKPFNLTLLTVDTHEPDGHLSRQCAAQGYSGFDGVITCTAAEVAQFVQFAQARGYLDNANIVILGDHLSRKNPLSDDLSRTHRTIFNTFISKQPVPATRDQLVHFDLLPSILEFIGFDIPGGRLGLGYSAFNRHATAPSQGRLADMDSDLLNRSDTYLGLWQERPAVR
ncbi:phosphatidylglycerol--membrane-oligosaccharide glycerophosphotransferase [Massilia arenosa]|uniref:Phosphatidylglycerol--membrane-oligosaccharide glycerophosphotransferase n=1 Tax=Zemynaea arenosa TaxID=2561931 RepID=A0A4Y9SRB1_9BURK|nr:sulfatase-like hydrolase/transferase [Massilia arenosa]TFW29220.1 phosphatidylglycerol--membrane-oligosaccharide glycerophosphotransferase [Massilia arenosa]